MKESLSKKWDIIYKFEREYGKVYHEVALKFNLSDNAFDVLYALYDIKRPCTQRELCDYLETNKQTINSTIKNLIKRNYIQMGFNEDNKTNKKVGLTLTGMKKAEQTIKLVTEVEEKAWEKIEEEDLDKAISIFQTIFSEIKMGFDKKIGTNFMEETNNGN